MKKTTAVLLFALFLILPVLADYTYKTGAKMPFYPESVEALSFKGADTPMTRISGVKHVEGDIWEIRLTCALLTNSTADGTYAAEFCYYVKKGDVISFNNQTSGLLDPKVYKYEITDVSWNTFSFKKVD